MGRDLSRVLDAVLDGVLVLDASGRVELINSEASRLLETSGSTARGTPVELLMGPEHAIAVLARGVLESGRTAIETERSVERRYEPDVVVDVAASPLFDDIGRVNGAVLALRDRTIQQSLAALVSEREHLASFGRMATGIAHEVKNPLGGIRGAAELVAARSGEARTTDAAELIIREVDRIAALVDDLMVFAHSDEIEETPLNIHRILEDVLDLLSMDPLSARVRLERRFDPSIPELLGDADRLAQVFLNLCRNALQALEGRDGCLRITTRMTLDNRLATERGEHLPTLLVEIQDDGPGIAPEVLERLGTPFFTTRKDGTGLGLAVARHWVARHEGTLRIDSRPGSGTNVGVALPLRRAP
jgi:two-component system nitrogen regulation sensor histidine kinase GlnL